MVPYIFDSSISIALYSVGIIILILGLKQFFEIKTGKTEKVRSLVPFGAIAACLGFIGQFYKVYMAMDTLEAAGDISPALVAGAIKEGPPYVILGLLILAVSFLFKFVNQK